MRLTVLSPEKEILSCEVTAVELPGAKGRFEVLAGHAPLLSPLIEGVIRYKADGGEKTIPVEGGFVEVKGDFITVCVG